MADDVVVFDGQGADRIANAVRWTDRQSRRPARWTSRPMPALEHQAIRVTSGTADGDGYYPAEVVVYDLDADDWEAMEGGAVAVGIWGETLAADAYYLAVSIGETSGGDVLYQVVPSPLQVVTSQSGTQHNVWQLRPDGTTGILSSVVTDGVVSIYGQEATTTLWGMVTPNTQSWAGQKTLTDQLRALNGIRVATGGVYDYPLMYLEASAGAKITHHLDASTSAYLSLTAGTGDGIGEATPPTLRVITTDDDMPILEISAGAGGGGTVNGLEGVQGPYTFIAGWAVDYDGSLASPGTVTSVAVSGGTTGLTTSGGPITTTGTITLSGTLALANGGTGASLSDPNADRILFWDDSASAVAWLTPGSSLLITTTTIDVATAGITSAMLRNSAAVSVIGRSANSSGVPADIAAATNGTFLGRRSDALDFLNPRLNELQFRGAWVYRTTNQSIPKTTWTAIQHDNEYLDTDTYHDNATNNTRLTATTTGRHLVGGCVTVENHNNTQLLALRANGTTYFYLLASEIGSASLNHPQVIAGLLSLSAGDYVELTVYLDTGGAKNCVAANFWMVPVGVT